MRELGQHFGMLHKRLQVLKNAFICNYLQLIFYLQLRFGENSIVQSGLTRKSEP